MDSKHTCPECNLIFDAELPQTGVLVCPLCNSEFSAQPPAGHASTPVSPSPATSGRQVLRGVVAIGALFFLAGGFGYAYHLMSGIGRKTTAVPTPAATSPPAPVAAESPLRVEIIPVIPAEPLPMTKVAQPKLSPPPPEVQSIPSPRPPEPQPLVIPKEVRRPLTVLEKRVNRAIDRGLAYLRKYYRRNNEYRNYLGLLGLTLLECGISPDDFTVRQIASWIRTEKKEITQTYELTLAILFLDRLGDPRDRPLIRTFGQQLLAGQLDGGAWTYSCLMNDPKRFRPPVPLHIQWTGFPDLKHFDRVRGGGYRGDNSNTQFAILGLWVAQRHGVPARAALLAAEQYFRDTQLVDGSWTYNPYVRFWRDSMTCAGLMSLAMRYGVIGGQGRDIRPNHPIVVNDATILDGLRYLANALDKITVEGDRIVGAEARESLYFLWTLERMAVIYDLKKIGRREWYPWAAQMLVDTQWQDGRWSEMGDVIGTCFALLILKRSNFAQDLQLAVLERPVLERPVHKRPGQVRLSRPMPDLSGPTTILQGMDAILRQTTKPQAPASVSGTAISPSPSTPLGPSITRTPNTK